MYFKKQKLTNIINPFDQDKKIKILRRNRIAKKFRNYNFLKKYSANDFLKKLKKEQKNFNLILEIGSHSGELTEKLKNLKIINNIVASDISSEMIKLLDNNLKINFDEQLIPFKEGVFEGIFSCLYLNQSKNLDELLLKFQKLLKKDGFLLFSIFGSESLKELKTIFLEVESKMFNGVYPRINNFFDLKTLGDLLLKLGFKNPVVEKEIIKVKYNSLFSLMRDLRGMGETNILIGRKKNNDLKSFFSQVENLYLKRNNNKNCINFEARFEILTASCWKEK